MVITDHLDDERDHSGCDIGSCVITLHHASSQLKVWHWQTRRHGHHHALDFLVTNLRKLVDQLAEIASGHMLRAKLARMTDQPRRRQPHLKLSVHRGALHYDDLDVASKSSSTLQTQRFVIEQVERVEKTRSDMEESPFCQQGMSDVLSILDDILAILHHGLYLMDLR